MDYKGSLEPYLDTYPDWVKINELGNSIFKQGNFELIDELTVELLPIINIVYYKSIKRLDDRYYAREDLIQDTLLEIYKDIKYRWDKYILVDNYPKYFESISRNVMVNLVHYHHKYYKEKSEFNPDINYGLIGQDNHFEIAEAEILKKEVSASILALTRKLATFRRKHAKILSKIIDEIYLNDNVQCLNLKSKLRVLGVDKEQFEFLREHVFYLHRFSYNYYRASIGGKSKMILRMDDVIKRYESPTYAVLAENYSDSLIPEIYAELGPDVAQRFIKIFSGRTLKVPDYRDFCDDLMGGTIYSMARGDKDNLYKIAADNNLSYKTLSRIFDRAKKQIYGGK